MQRCKKKSCVKKLYTKNMIEITDSIIAIVTKDFKVKTENHTLIMINANDFIQNGVKDQGSEVNEVRNRNFPLGNI